MLQEFYTSWISRPTTPSWRYPWKVIIPEGATIPESLYRHPGGQFVVNKIQGCHHQSLNAAYAAKTLLRFPHARCPSLLEIQQVRSTGRWGLGTKKFIEHFFLVRGGRFNIQHPENEYIYIYSTLKPQNDGGLVGRWFSEFQESVSQVPGYPESPSKSTELWSLTWRVVWKSSQGAVWATFYPQKTILSRRGKTMVRFFLIVGTLRWFWALNDQPVRQSTPNHLQRSHLRIESSEGLATSFQRK